MSLPAAASPDPIAVLVLAWDEATPAVRALVEATQASAPPLDSLLVMVPQPAAPNGLSAEEFLPLPADLPVPTAPETEVLLPAAELPTAPAAPTAEHTEHNELPNPALPAATAARPPALPIWASVRVLRLGSLNPLASQPGQPLPAPIWAGAVVAPAAPYLGAAAPASEQPAPRREAMPTGDTPAPALGLSEFLTEQPATPAIVAAEPLPTADVDLPAAEGSVAAPTITSVETAAQAPDLETDLVLAETAELIDAEVSKNDLPLADEFLLDTENTAGLAAPAEPYAPTPQPEPLAAVPPVQLAPPPASPAPAALRPADQHYPAPDLNYQIIQYARLAVPLALAEPEFAAIYAPAWPTWLAAQELRQRTGQPLVLHVAALAAADTETIDTAAGWVAELQRQALRRADLILAETPALAQRLRRELGLHYGMVLTIPAAEAGAVAQALREARLKPAA